MSSEFGDARPKKIEEYFYTLSLKYYVKFY